MCPIGSLAVRPREAIPPAVSARHDLRQIGLRRTPRRDEARAHRDHRRHDDHRSRTSPDPSGVTPCSIVVIVRVSASATATPTASPAAA